MSSTYIPRTTEVGAPYAGNGSLYRDDIWENHEAVYGIHAPTVICQTRSMTDTNVSLRQWIRWRMRGNLDLHTVRVRGYYTIGGVGGVMSAFVGTASATTTISATGWANINVTPVAGVVQDCLLYCDVPGVGNTITMDCLNVNLTPATRVTKQASGYVGDDEVTDTPGFPVNIEHVDRVERGPLLIARDRPHCVFAVNPRIPNIMAGKGPLDWMDGNTTSTTIAGQGLMPKVDDRPRRFIVDAFVAQSAAGACAAELRIGAWRWAIPSTGTWQSTEVVLPPESLGVVGTITATAGVWGQFQGIQIWRM